MLPLPEPPLRFVGGTLRAWTETDAPRLVDAWADAAIAEYNPVPADPTIQTAAHWISGAQTRRAKGLALDLVIESDDHAGIVGEVGLSGFRRAHRGALIGYWLLPEARGHGLATLAVMAVAGWAWTALDLQVLVARCHEDNAESQDVARRAGFVHEANDEASHQLWRARAPE